MPELTWDQIDAPQNKQPATSAKPALTWDQVEAPKPASEQAHADRAKSPQLYGKMTPEQEKAAGIKGLKKFGKDVIDVADMILTLPAFAGGIGVQAGAYIKGAMQGRDHRDVSSVAHYAQQEYMKSAELIGFANPIKRILGVAGLSDKLEEGHVEHAMGAIQKYIDKGGEYVEHVSHGKVNKDDVTYLADIVQTFAGAKIGDTAAAGARKLGKFIQKEKPVPESEMTSGKPSSKTVDDILNRYSNTPEGKSSPVDSKRGAKIVEGYIKADKDIKTYDIAHGLVKRGASIKEVEATIKRYPHLEIEKTMDEIMSRRQDVIKGASGDMIMEPKPGEVSREPATSAPPQLEKPAGEPPSALPGAPSSPRTPPYLESGKIDKDLLTKLGLVGGGALVASKISKDEPIEAAIIGGMAGMAALRLPDYVKAVKENTRSTLVKTATVAGVTGGLAAIDKEHPVEGAMLGALWGGSKMLPKSSIPKVGNMTIDDFVNARNGAVEAQMREVHNVAYAIRTAVPDESRREAIARAVDKGDLSGLSPTEKKVAEAYKGFTKDFGDAAKDSGVLKDLVKNYVSHIVEKKGLPTTKVEEAMQAVFGGVEGSSKFSGSSRFAKARKYETFDQLQKALEGTDLQIKTMDLADITEIYGRSMARAIENRKLVNNLQAFKVGDNPLIGKVEDMPANYKAVDAPQLQGMAVHPDIAPSLKFVMERTNPGDVTKGLLALSMAQKRLVTSVSFFHAQNLANAYAGAMGLDALKGKTAIDAALKAYREGGNGDAVDTLVRNGLKVAPPIETDVAAMQKIGAMLDYGVEKTTGVKTSVAEKTLGGIERIQRDTFDKLTWDYMHQGMKLAVGLKEFERITLKHPEMPKDEVARQVSSYVNDTFGGLDWYRVATESQSQLGRKIGLSLLNPKGQQALQILMFAPDWTMSTFRSMYKALPGNDAMPLTQGLHLKYMLRTGLIYATILNGVNMVISGHPIWENNDPTQLEYADGSTQQVAKHAMEGPEWLMKPRQMALNKLGYVPSEAIAQLTGKEYLSASGHAPPMKSRIGHLVNKITPISVQGSGDESQDVGDSIKKAALNVIGMQIRPPKKAKKKDSE